MTCLDLLDKKRCFKQVTHKGRLSQLHEYWQNTYCLTHGWILQATLQIMQLTKKVVRTTAFIQTSQIILFYRWLTKAACLAKHLHNLVCLQLLFKLLVGIQWKRKMAVPNWKSFKIPSALLQSLLFVTFHSLCMIATLLSTIAIHC